MIRLSDIVRRIAPALALIGCAVAPAEAGQASAAGALDSDQPGARAPATEQPRIYLSPDGRTLYLIGTILDGSFKRFDAVLSAAAQARTVYLSSPGGLTLEARLIAAEVRKRGLNTYVEHYCASACTQIFVAGRDRVVGREAVLGFHQAVGVDRLGRTTRVTKPTATALNSTKVFGINGNDTLRLAYELAGIDKPFIDKVLARSHDDMWMPTVPELSGAHVITRQANSTEFPAPDGSITKDALRALLASKPIWARAAKLFPAAYDKGFASAWRLANSGSPVDLAASAGRGEFLLTVMDRFAQASDDLLARHLSLYTGEARFEIANGFPGCVSRVSDSARPISKRSQNFEQLEDMLIIEALDHPPAEPPMTKAAVMKVFIKDVLPLLSDDFTTSSDCKAGFQMIQAIAALSGKKRIRAYRAILYLPAVVGD